MAGGMKNNMDMPEFDKMTEEIAEVVERYGLQVDFGCGTLGDNVSITLEIRTPDAADQGEQVSEK